MLRSAGGRVAGYCTVLAAAFIVVDSSRADDPAWIARGKAGMVAADHPQASEIGAAVLRDGGNAFDAAVAVSFALSVCRPESTGIGGGGFMLAYVAKEQRFVALDFREVAPAAATPERYKALSDAAKAAGRWSPSVYGGNAVGVPGQVAGLGEIHRRFGTREWGKLVEPAIRLAEDGFIVDAHYREACADARKTCEKYPALQAQCGRLHELLTRGGDLPPAGSRVQRTALAEALRLIERGGAKAFYEGPIAEAIVQAVRSAGGGMTRSDIGSYRVIDRVPLSTRFQRQQPHGQLTHDFQIMLLPPPSSGGICLTEMFAVANHLPEFRCGFEPLSFHEHYLVEAMKHAFANRARWLGESIDASLTSRLTSASYLDELWQSVSREQCTYPIDEYGLRGTAAAAPDDRGTSHFCVADREGNIVALTETVNGSFGSFVLTEPYEIVLNNQLDDFTTVLGDSNLFGLKQGAPNLIAPGKRPLSSMSPTIILKDGQPFLALGASGGPRIITSVLQVALNVMDGDELADAMVKPRFHHQWQPDLIYFDREPPSDLVAALEKLGHKISPERHYASVQAIEFLPDGTRIGASDPNKGGRPAAE